MQSVSQQQSEITRKELQILFGNQGSQSAPARLTGRDVSLVHTATSCLLTELGGPPSYRMICGVIGFALGSSDKFKCADVQLAKRIWPDSDATDESFQKRLARSRDKLIEWQNQNKITILKYTQGDKTRDASGKITYHPTEWECPVLPLIEQIIDDATMESDYDLHPGQAMHRVAATIAKIERLKMPTAGKRTRRPRSRFGFDWLMKMALGFIRKAQSESGLTLDEVIGHLRTLENSQVVDSKESAPSDILSYGGPNFVPHEDIKEGDKVEPKEGPQRGSEPEPPLSVGLSPSREKQALESLCVFISRGYKQFFFRLENESRDTVRHSTYTATEALDIAPLWLMDADKRHASFMVRPQLEDDDAQVRPRAIHLDDLDVSRFEKVSPLAALGFESSPDRYQAFVFVTAAKPEADAIKKRLVQGLNSDRGANGAFRIPGSRNFKRTRGGCDVRLHVATFGDSWTPAQLEDSGLLAPPEPPVETRPRAVSNNGSWKFPDYERCIRDANRKEDGVTPDYSAADLAWANISRERGVPQEAAHSELERLRDALDGKPSRHASYITRTIERAYE